MRPLQSRLALVAGARRPLHPRNKRVWEHEIQRGRRIPIRLRRTAAGGAGPAQTPHRPKLHSQLIIHHRPIRLEWSASGTQSRDAVKPGAIVLAAPVHAGVRRAACSCAHTAPARSHAFSRRPREALAAVLPRKAAKTSACRHGGPHAHPKGQPTLTGWAHHIFRCQRPNRPSGAWPSRAGKYPSGMSTSALE